MPRMLAHYNSISGVSSASGPGREFLTWGSGIPLRSDFTNTLWVPWKAQMAQLALFPCCRATSRVSAISLFPEGDTGGPGKGGAWAMGTVTKLVVL